VDHVDDLAFVDPPADRRVVVDGEVTGIRLAPHELAAVTVVDDTGRPGPLPVIRPEGVGVA
jgi:hypothetical protein